MIEALAALAAIAGAAFAGFALWSSARSSNEARQLAEETRRLWVQITQEQNKPILSLTFEKERSMSGRMGHVYLRNLGKSPAFNIRITVTSVANSKNARVLTRSGLSAAPNGLTKLLGPVAADELHQQIYTIRSRDLSGQVHTSRMQGNAHAEDIFEWLFEEEQPMRGEQP